jgi:hypothetical protein
MKLAGAALLLVALIAVAAASVQLTFERKAALTTIDTVPSTDDLAQATLSVPDDLVAIALAATDDGSTVDPGVRLRAIHGLAVYCTATGNSCPDGGAIHAALEQLITSNAGAHAGSDLLLLRAAIESDGPLKVQTDLSFLAPLLDHPSRDIRAATARALAQLKNCQATSALRQRYQNESTDQVKLAISEALRILSQPSSCQ